MHYGGGCLARRRCSVCGARVYFPLPRVWTLLAAWVQSRNGPRKLSMQSTCGSGSGDDDSVGPRRSSIPVLLTPNAHAEHINIIGAAQARWMG